MDTLASSTPSTPLDAPTPLRKLYLARFTFAAVWAALLATTAHDLGALSVTLLLIYPLIDMAAAVTDLRTAHAEGRAAAALYANVSISALAAAGLALAATADIPAVLRVWGAWAIVSGILQLITGAVRRHLGGQWPMIISGTISTLAGASFIAQAGNEDATLKNLAGYAFLGGVFFLISALRLNRPARRRT